MFITQFWLILSYLTELILVSVFNMWSNKWDFTFLISGCFSNCPSYVKKNHDATHKLLLDAGRLIGSYQTEYDIMVSVVPLIGFSW